MSTLFYKTALLAFLLSTSFKVSVALGSANATVKPEVCERVPDSNCDSAVSKQPLITTDSTLQNTATIEDALKQDLGRNFGGTWLEYDIDHKAHRVVGVTTFTHRSSTIAANPDFILVHVTYSIDQLTAALDAINARYVLDATAPLHATTTMIDVRRNRVVIGVEKADMDTMKKALEADGYDMNMLHVEYIKRPVAASH